MRTLSGFGLSIALALLGAAVWVGLSMAIDTRLWVILACALGGLAGYGMGIGTKAAGGAGHGVLAGLACLIGCFTATGVIGYLRADQFVQDEMAITDDIAYENLCSTTYQAWLEDGLIEWDDSEDYPAEVYQSADEQWAAMSDSDREQYKAGLAAEWTGGLGEDTMTGVIGAAAFIWQWFGILPIICLCSGIGTAFKIGSYTKDEAQDEIPAWALGAPAAAPSQAGAEPAPGVPAPASPPIARPTPGAAPQAAIGQPEDAAASFWNKLGSDAPARSTPSLKRAPKAAPDAPAAPAAGALGEPPASKAA